MNTDQISDFYARMRWEMQHRTRRKILAAEIRDLESAPVGAPNWFDCHIAAENRRKELRSLKFPEGVEIGRTLPDPAKREAKRAL